MSSRDCAVEQQSCAMIQGFNDVLGQGIAVEGAAPWCCAKQPHKRQNSVFHQGLKLRFVLERRHYGT